MTFRTALAIFSALALVACGQGLSVPPVDGPLRQATATTGTQRIERLFDFGELRYPELFPSHQPTRQWGPWTYRFYPETGIHLGVQDDGVYVMGGPFGTTPRPQGVVSDYVAGGGEPTAVRLGPMPAAVTAGDFVAVAFGAFDASGRALADARPGWTTSDPSVAQVTTRGLVLVTGPGIATITASVGTLSAAVAVHAQPRGVPDGEVLLLLGPEETVFDYETQRCAEGDIPDTPAHAVRLADGSLLLMATAAPYNRLSAGPDFDHLQRRCEPALASLGDATPQSHRNNEWLHSLYREGDVLHALIHNEYTDPSLGGWYNSITAMRSTDGGRSFAPLGGVAAPVAPAPLRWDPAAPNGLAMQGYFNPSNVVAGGDGFFYVAFLAMPDPATTAENSGLCVMRTATLSDPASWRAWDGTAFALQMLDPYRTDGPVPVCRAVTPVVTQASLTYNSYLQRFMLVNNLVDYSSGRPDCGFFYQLSVDGIAWSSPRKFRDAYSPPWMPGCVPPTGATGGMAYASVIDHASASDNFETAGQTAYVYSMRTMSSESQTPRNLVRQPMILLKPPSWR